MLKYHCKNGDVDMAIQLMRNLRPLPLSPFKPDHYVLVLAKLIEYGHLRYDLIYFIIGLFNIVLTHIVIFNENNREGGAKVFYDITSELASQACEISQSSAIRLHNALVKEFGTLQHSLEGDDIPIRNTVAKEHEFLACGVHIDPSTWICNVTNIQLLSHSLKSAKRKQMYDELKLLGQRQSEMANELEKFLDWLK